MLPLHPFALRYKYLPHWLLLDLIVNNGINAIYGNHGILKIFRLVEVVVCINQCLKFAFVFTQMIIRVFNSGMKFRMSKCIYNLAHVPDCC